MVSLIHLPEIIFRLIQTFLSYDDYHYFLNTSKKEFGDLKRRTIILQLTRKMSAQYMQDKEFQSLVLSQVADGWKQIRIAHGWDWGILVPVYDASIPHDGIELLHDSQGDLNEIEVLLPLSPQVKTLSLDFAHLKDISALSDHPRLSRVTLWKTTVLEDISPLKNIPDLTFRGCLALSDVSVFHGKTVQRFQLRDSPLLMDVTGLSNVRTLDLSYCEGLTDVSPLHGVYNLSISFCENVKDISGLGDHYRLNISNCANTLTGYESLAGIPHVTLGRCDISDVSVLRYAKSIELKACNQITDISSIKNVKRIVLEDISSINNISELCDVYDLCLTLVPLKEEDIVRLRNHKLELFTTVHDLTILMENASCLESTKHFKVHCPSTSFVNSLITQNTPFFRHLQTLIIEHAFHLTKIRGLEDIPTVKLHHLSNLSDISGLGRNRYVELTSCNKVEDVSSLANVSIVRIYSCAGIKDYSVLSQVPRLKIIETFY